MIHCMTQSYRVFVKKLLVLHPLTRDPGPFSESVRPTKWSRTRGLHYLDAHHAHGQRHAGGRRRCMTKSEDTVRRPGWPRGTQDPRGKRSPRACAPSEGRRRRIRRWPAASAAVSAATVRLPRCLTKAIGSSLESTWTDVSSTPPRPPQARLLDSARLVGDRRSSLWPRRPRSRTFSCWTCENGATE